MTEKPIKSHDAAIKRYDILTPTSLLVKTKEIIMVSKCILIVNIETLSYKIEVFRLSLARL